MSLESTLTNAGTVNWTGGTLYLYACGYAPGPVVNLPGGLWSIQCDQYLSYYDDCTAPASGYFLNLGTLQKQAGTGTTSISIPFDNLGAVAGLAGTLDFNNGGTIAGSYSATNGAVVGFAAGSFSNAVPAALSGPGAIQFSGGGLLLLSNEMPDLAMTGGTVSLGAGFQGGTITNLTSLGSTLSGNWTVSGLFNCGGGASGNLLVAGGASMNWSGGTISGPLTIASNGVLNLAGPSTMSLESTLTNAGTVNWTGGTLYLYACGYAPGPVVNLPGGLWSIQCDQYLSYYDDCTAPASGYFLNLGTIQKQAGTGTTSIGIPVDNPGTVDSQAGKLTLSSVSLQSSSVLNVGLNSSTDYGSIALLASVILNGTISANLNNGFVPAKGEVFDVLSYPSFSGTFANTNLPAGAPGQGICGTNVFSLLFTGTSPSTNQPVLTIDRVNANTVAVSWPTAAGDFSLQTTTNLSSGNWSNVISGITTVGADYVLTNAVNGKAAFFRLQSQ
jgi:hypothetical protein